ncbi:MAG TPA: ABC transporter substrate-binding protein [Burkholderiales bacterium]|nr:ABC transporter substrate-binding protein [Burkholderiales bacterium]
MNRIVLAASLIAALAAFPASAQQPKANIGYIGAADFTPLFVAKDKGFFDKHGLDATLTRIQIAPNVAPAIISGDLQIGMGTGPNLLHAAEGGLPLVAIAGASRMKKSNPIAGLLGRSGLSIKTPADLRGKKIGSPGLNTMLTEMLEKWLHDNKITRDQVTLVEVVFPQQRDMLKSGNIDAVITIEPFRSRMLSDGTAFTIADYVGEVNPDLLAVLWLSRNDWAAANPKAVQAFRAAYAEAIEWCAKNADESKKILAKYIGFASPVLPDYGVEVKLSDLEFFERVQRELGKLRAPVDVSKLVWK